MKPAVVALVVLAVTALTGLRPVAAAPAQSSLTIFAAASLTEVVDTLAHRYAEAHAIPVKTSLAASSILARQIEAGARADVFISADREWMDYLADRGLVDAPTRSDLLGNRLVLVAPATAAIRPDPDLPALLRRTALLATGDPDFVPVGRYARAALESLGVWPELRERLVRAENVRAALAFVARGEAGLGIVYATDARIEPRVKVVATFPPGTHPAIVYPVAIVHGARPQAGAFVQYLRSAEARALFEAAGFTVLPP